MISIDNLSTVFFSAKISPFYDGFLRLFYEKRLTFFSRPKLITRFSLLQSVFKTRISPSLRDRVYIDNLLLATFYQKLQPISSCSALDLPDLTLAKMFRLKDPIFRNYHKF